MRGRWIVAFVLLMAMPHGARAQSGTVAGIVVASGSQRPLAGAQVAVEGQVGRGAVTDGSGGFRVTGLDGTTVVLIVRLLGYRPVTDTARVGATGLRFALQERALELDALVVTGTAGGAEKRELGTSVADVKVADVMAHTSVPSMEGLLDGRAPGVDIIGTSGQVGAGAQIRVRGVGTFSLSSTPLVYVDGIRTDNGQSGQITQVVMRFNDIAPEEIERIEVLKGPAAATLYGTEAARGVINIITKRGDPGAPTYTFTAQAGTQWFQNAAGRFPTNYWINPATNQLLSINYVKSEAAHGTPLFRDGDINRYTASASGGAGVYRYFVSGELSKADGIVVTNGRVQKNIRTNLSIVPSSKVDVETSVGYVTSRTYVAFEGGNSGPMLGEYAQPQRTVAACPAPAPRGCGWSRGHVVSPPEVTNATQRWEDVQRFTGSFSMKYDPFPWMSHRFLIGTDYSAVDINQYLPFQTDSVIVFFLAASYDGSRLETTRQTTYNTYDYSGSAHFNLRPDLVSKSSIGLQYYTNSLTSLSASGTHFPTPGLSTISATGTKAAPTSSLAANNTLGAYVQQEFALNNRLFVTGALRVDNNSAFGSQVRFTTYPKVSLSWVATDEPRARRILPSFVSEVRLRAAYGGSGQQPVTNSALKTRTPVAGPGGTTTLTNGTIGNPDLRPERVLGTELGFEAGLWQDRVGIDLTLFSDISRDAILASTVPPSTAFGASTQFRNAGQINKHGIELSLKGEIISRRDYGWNTQFIVAGTTSKIIRIGAAQDTLINVAPITAVATVGDVFQRVGYSPFDLFTYRVVSATFDAATGKAINPMCDDGKGGVMPCFAPGASTPQAPLLYFGHSIPTTTGSWTNTFRYRRVRLHVMVDFQAGHRKTDIVFEQNCQIFFVCPIVVFPSRYGPAVVATAQNGNGQLQDYFIRSAAFTQMREVALSYDAPPSVAHRLRARTLGITLSARNVAKLTRFTGVDPENSVSAVGGNSNNLGTSQAGYPQLASAVVTFRLSY